MKRFAIFTAMALAAAGYAVALVLSPLWQAAQLAPPTARAQLQVSMGQGVSRWIVRITFMWSMQVIFQSEKLHPLVL